MTVNSCGIPSVSGVKLKSFNSFLWIAQDRRIRIGGSGCGGSEESGSGGSESDTPPNSNTNFSVFKSYFTFEAEDEDPGLLPPGAGDDFDSLNN